MNWAPTIFFLLWTSTSMADEHIATKDSPDIELMSLPGMPWRLVTDGVMGGVSSGMLKKDSMEGKPCTLLSGEVSLQNNGGFIQAAMDISDTAAANASAYQGVMLEVYGNDQEYNLHLRTGDVWLPWQSYRASFVAKPQWQVIKLPFSEFSGYRIRTPLDVARLKRIGVLAIGREFTANLCIGELALYRDSS